MFRGPWRQPISATLFKIAAVFSFSTGFGIGFSLSVILPSFYAFYMDWLSGLMPLSLTPVVLLAVGGLIGTVGAIMGPETRDVDFSDHNG